MAARLHRTVTGPDDGPPLVLSSSLGATAAMWDPQIPEFSQRFRTIAYDHRGHGGSEAPDGPYELEDFGSDVLAMLDELGIERAHFCGLSLGGMVALWLGAHAPGRLASLTICCSSARPGNEPAWTERIETVRAADSVKPVAAAVASRWTTPAFAAANPGVVERLEAMLAANAPDAYAACCRVVRDLDLVDDLDRITAPSLVISGAQDEALRPEHQRLIAGAIPGARLETIDPGAHLPNIEQPEVFSALVTRHVEENA